MADTGDEVKQDIAGPIKKAYDWLSGKVDWEKPAEPKKVDQSWHDDMVKQANESFKPKTPKLADRKPLGTAKTTKKKSGSKQTARKR